MMLPRLARPSSSKLREIPSISQLNTRAPRHLAPLEAIRLVRLARECRHREPHACPCCPRWCRRDRREVSTADCIGCLKDGRN